MNNDLSRNEQLVNMIIGIIGETGEVADLIKKHLYQGHNLNILKIQEEIGDIMFYIANLCSLLEIDLSEAITRNYNKLLKRYPDGFESSKSINRVE